jgi:hypothetical protein
VRRVLDSSALESTNSFSKQQNTEYQSRAPRPHRRADANSTADRTLLLIGRHLKMFAISKVSVLYFDVPESLRLRVHPHPPVARTRCGGDRSTTFTRISILEILLI